MQNPKPYHWWQSGVIYQIYPRSFQDSDGDGIGDLNGILARLDYLKWLGIDAMWISPCFPSPMADYGYDVANYTDIDPIFGSLEDFDRLVAEAHARQIRIILDFVPNHTSDQHSWFLDSKQSRGNAKRDWYIWRDPSPDGGPPNNWLSDFGGSAWQFDASTGQYYYHSFLKEQPDLNWRNPQVKAAMLDVLRFWFERGVDGFRIDVLWYLIKDDLFRDNPPNPDFREGMAPTFALHSTYTSDRPEVFDVIADMRRLAESYGSRVLIGEIYLPIERLVAYYGTDGTGVHLPMNFHLLTTPWNAKAISAVVKHYESAIPVFGWPNWVLGNHDRPRVATRIGQQNLRLAAMLLLTLRGTPTLYYGDEIGMENLAHLADVLDPYEKQVGGFGLGRDPARSPMQWDASQFAGFSDVKPWLPVHQNSSAVNVHTEKLEQTSLLQLYRQLLQLRRQESALNSGIYETRFEDGKVFAYSRRDETGSFVVALNFVDEIVAVPLHNGDERFQSVLSTLGRRNISVGGNRLELLPYEGVIGRIT